MTQQRLGRGEEARRSLARYEEWLKGQKFATWYQTTHWGLLHEEARELILVMPRTADQSGRHLRKMKNRLGWRKKAGPFPPRRAGEEFSPADPSSRLVGTVRNSEQRKIP